MFDLLLAGSSESLSESKILPYYLNKKKKKWRRIQIKFPQYLLDRSSVVELVQSWPAPVPATGSGSGYRFRHRLTKIFKHKFK